MADTVTSFDVYVPYHNDDKQLNIKKETIDLLVYTGLVSKLLIFSQAPNTEL